MKTRRMLTWGPRLLCSKEKLTTSVVKTEGLSLKYCLLNLSSYILKSSVSSGMASSRCGRYPPKALLYSSFPITTGSCS